MGFSGSGSGTTPLRLHDWKNQKVRPKSSAMILEAPDIFLLLPANLQHIESKYTPQADLLLTDYNK